MTDQLDDNLSGQGADAPVLDSNAPADGSQSRPENRDERGRFAAQQQQDDASAAQQEQPGRPPEGYVPIQALDARLAKQAESFQREREAFLKQLAAFAPQPQREATKQVPHFFDDPDAAFDARLRAAIDPLQQGQQTITENFSRMMATDKFGEDTVNAAMAEIEKRVNQNPNGMRATYDRIMRAPHPYGELVKWHKEQSALSTYGDDPEAYIAAEVERRLAAAGGGQGGGQQLQPQQQQRTQTMPSSFAGSRNNGPRSAAPSSGARPLSEIMGGR